MTGYVGVEKRSFPYSPDILLNPVSQYRPPVKRGFLSFFMEIDFTADQIFCLVSSSPMNRSPTRCLAALRNDSMVQSNEYSSYASLRASQVSPSKILKANKIEALSHHKRQGLEDFSLPYMGRTIIQFS
jgi:hypothetical protein